MARLFVEMSTPRRVWEAGGATVLAGLVTGVLDEVNRTAFVVAVAVSVIGGLPSGAQHRTARGAVCRGSVDGGLWAAAVLVAIAVVGLPPLEPLANPPIAFLPLSVGTQVVITVAVWFAASRYRDGRSRPG